ncbi:hypothetical protein JXB31_03930, partial [Candidatus Woesearchaeota archaeon]|nr:hypothetical protein [Candidatus Woesearchaeota archaeon]
DEEGADEGEPADEEGADEGEPADEEGADEEPAAEDDMITKTFTAGELVSLKPKATDADNDVVVFSFSEPLDEKGEWQTVAGDDGEYIITITASDGISEVSKKVKLIILSANKAPVIEDIPTITVSAGETVTLNPVVTDAEGDDVTISYSGWMDESTKVTTADDIGTNQVIISADDGNSIATKKVTIIVEKVNHAPVIGELESITVKEGELVEVSATATDEDNDEVTISYSEPLDDEGRWQTKIDDAGTYAVIVTASDGKLTDEKSVTIIVNKANSAPVIEMDDVSVIVVVGETKTVVLEPVVTDADGDEVSISYSGFMTDSSKTVTSEDSGEHTVTITADDGKTTTSLDITVSIAVNNPPVFEI